MREEFWVGGDVSIRWWVIEGQPGRYMTTMMDRGHLYNNQQRFGYHGAGTKVLYGDIIVCRLHPFEG